MYSHSSKKEVTIDRCIYHRRVTYHLFVSDSLDTHSVRFLQFPGNLCYLLNYLPSYQYLKNIIAPLYAYINYIKKY